MIFVKLYRVISSIMAVNGHEKFDVSVYEMDVKETNLNYVWKGTRLPKGEVGFVKQTHNGNSLICFQMYVFGCQLDEAKIKVVESIKEWIVSEMEKLQLFERIVQGQPTTSHEVMEENGEWKRKQ